MKPLTEVTQVDERQKFFGTLEALHEELSDVVLHPSVPANVQEVFDTARNLSLYSWFVYDFHSIAELTGFLALEAALKARARTESAELAKEKSFRKLMDKAVAEGWIAEDRIAGRREIARGRVEQRKALEAIQRLNELGVETIAIQEPTEEEVAREEGEMKVIELICGAAVKIRNDLAHGERLLSPGSYRRLRVTADLINQLYA